MTTGRIALGAFVAAGVAVFVASVAYIPHLDPSSQQLPEGPGLPRLITAYWKWLVEGSADDYEYPVHVDENMHWVAMASLERAESLRYPDPFTGAPRTEIPFSLRGMVHERGFHVAVYTFHAFTGVGWLEIVRFLPALWLGLTALVLGAALRGWTGAWVAAAFVALVPTSARFLGPGFLVPIGFGLAWIAGALLLMPHAGRDGRAHALLLVLAIWAFFIHLIAGFGVLLLALCALPFAKERKGFVLLAAAALVPVLALQQAFGSDIEREFDVIGGLPQDFTIFDQLGLPVLALWMVGCALAVARPPEGPARLAVTASAVASLAIFAIIAANVVGDLGLTTLYDRWHQPFALLASVPAALAIVAAIRSAGPAYRSLALRFPRLPRPPAWRPAFVTGLGIALLFVATAEPGVGYHLDEPYYRVLNDADWAMFNWVAANVDETRVRFLADPWKAPILTAMTGKEAATWLNPGSGPVTPAFLEYMEAGGLSEAQVVEWNVSLVIAPFRPGGTEFEEQYPGVHVLKSPHAERLAAVMAQARTS